ncbi:HlyD family secretion protein [Flavobacterium cheniae]|jgi:HlyD family secretion protein|uniref:HlyD family secretion protein n=2 Tax=Flavobacterium TaxID=237 RepID=A0A562KS38_9FLAO|nr:HlyD family efflux transporter periplasmic adaptor subunit [Flavobacterium cheniae]MBP9601468.1 HlyD family efflux transporter periplasmic adaptor subunit [Lutibacter sp.]TDR25584.1 HlyD family secretion protein [Flavobacterium cheniae]TWH98230.1 HlyD family secretion protein [Flavobacterium cheniae]
MKNIALLVLAMFIISCNKNNEKADAYGNFETTEITVSSESNGKIEFLNLEEGDVVEKGKTVGLIDTLQLYYTKMQLIASQKTVSSKSGNVLSQKQVLQEQLKTAKIEQTRIKNMFSENAATKRQVDEINGKVKVIEEQIKGVGTQNAPIKNEANSFSVQIEKINDQIKKCNLVNPIKGTVLTKYAEPNEVTTFGKPLYKIANLEEMNLRVYISETQLSSIKIGQQVKVKIDDFEQTKEYIGNIIWISSQAEFTPKIIQTKEERANLVYAVKIRVKNDGSLKIGMPAEIWIK